jgi:hypothetical protein
VKRLFQFSGQTPTGAAMFRQSTTKIYALGLLLGLLGALGLQSATSHAQADIKSLTVSPAVATKSGTTQTISVVGYNRNIKQEHFKGLSKAVVLQMQKQMEQVYRDLPDWKHDYALRHEPLNDGIVGPITLSWLQRFGFQFKVLTDGDYTPALAKNFDRIAQFGDKHRAELNILLSPEFEAWDQNQADKTKQEDFQIRRQGSDKELIDLVNRFRGMRKTAPRASTTNNVDDSAYFTYSLNQADLDILGGKDQIIQVLTTLKDKEFNSLEALKVATTQAMGGRGFLVKQLWPIVERNAADFDGYLINELALDKLKKNAQFPAAVVDELRIQGTFYFKTKALLEAFLEEKLNTESLFLASDEKQLLEDTTRVFDNIHLTDLALTTIKNELKGNIQNTGVPAIIVKLLSEIKDVNYPEVSLFRSAAISKIAMGIGACKFNSPSNNLYVASLRMGEAEFDLLEKELEAIRAHGIDGRNFLTQDLRTSFDEIGKLRSQISLCDEADVNKAKALIQQIYQTYLAVAVENTAKKKIPDEIATIQLRGGDCACALDDMAGIVYGFYPYWSNKQVPQTMNFHVLNRIAYYGLTVDNVGELRLGARSFDVRNGSAADNQFIRMAHQYNSKVDWMIQKNDWNGDWRKYSRENKQAVFKKLIVNITTLLRTPLTDTASRVKPYASLGISKQPTRGDGVTLYFQNYPQDADSALLFNEFYLALRKELAQEHHWINVLVSQEVFTGAKETKQGAFSLPNLVKLRKKSSHTGSIHKQGVVAIDEMILVLLEEPSTDAKKRLRADIEDERSLHGAERADLLRSLLPVLHFDNRNWQQLEDDIVYSSDNFGGVGMWSPSFDNLAIEIGELEHSCLNSKHIATCILKNYRYPEDVEHIPSAIEKFACVNRWWLQLALTAMLLVALSIAFLFYKFCEIRALVQRYFLWVAAANILPSLIIFTLLLLYDPYMVGLSKGNLPFIIAVGIIFFGMVFGYLYLRSRREVPQRQHATPQRQGLGFPIIAWSIENNEQGFRWIIRNRGTGFAIIKKIEILLDGQMVADAKTALEAVLGPDQHLQWKSLPLVGQKIMPGEALIGLSISDSHSAAAFEKKLKQHKLEVNILYFAANNEHWISDGREVSAVGGMA